MTSEEAQRRFFDRTAERYDSRFLRQRWPRNQQRKALAIERVLGAALAGEVVELGCGTGQIAELMLERNPRLRYVGLDLSDAMLDVARRRLERFADRAELRRVGGGEFAGVRADGAFGVDVLHHVERPLELLRTLLRALEPGAPVVFLEANPRFPLTALIGLLQREERAVLRIGPRRLRGWLRDAGFEGTEARWGELYTPPGPPVLLPLLDRLDRGLARAPIVRRLSLYVEARAQAPTPV